MVRMAQGIYCKGINDKYFDSRRIEFLSVAESPKLSKFAFGSWGDL